MLLVQKSFMTLFLPKISLKSESTSTLVCSDQIQESMGLDYVGLGFFNYKKAFIQRVLCLHYVKVNLFLVFLISLISVHTVYYF